MEKMMEFNKIHQLDCLEGMKQMEDNSVDCIITSPPYNINIDYADYNDDMSQESYLKWLESVLKEFFRLGKDKSLLALNVGNQRNSGLPHYVYFLLKKIGYKIIKEIFWYKGLYYIQGETIFMCSKTGEYNCYYKKNDGFYSNGQFSTVWEMRYSEKENRRRLKHNAFFTKKFPRTVIQINTKEGDLVLDPFMGTGTTALACQELHRNFIGFEISEEYIKISDERLSQKTLRGFQKELSLSVIPSESP